MSIRTAMSCVALAVVATAVTAAQGPARTAFRPGALVFVDHMPDDFDTFLKAALTRKKVPVTVVDMKDSAQFEIKGTSETQKASAAKKAFMLDWHSDEQASISVVDVKTGDVVFAYSVNKRSSAHGRQSTAEACAKHLKQELEKHAR